MLALSNLPVEVRAHGFLVTMRREILSDIFKMGDIRCLDCCGAQPMSQLGHLRHSDLTPSADDYPLLVR